MTEPSRSFSAQNHAESSVLEPRARSPLGVFSEFDESAFSAGGSTQQWAARLDRASQERLLAQHAADPSVFNACDKDGHTPLTRAVVDKDLARVAFLAPLSDLLARSRGPRLEWTPLMHAIDERSPECVQILLEHNPAAQCALSQNTAPGQRFSPPLDMAIPRDEAAILELLLPWAPKKSALDPGHVPGRTLLMNAAGCGSLECVKTLVKIDPINACDSEGFSALTHAARLGRQEVVEHLLALPGIDAENHAPPPPDAYGFSRFEGISPFVAALSTGHAGAAKLLAPRSSMTEARLFEGSIRTPLMAAAKSGNHECVDLVLPFSAAIILDLSSSDPDAAADEEEDRDTGEISNDQPTQKTAFEWALSEFQWEIADKIGAQIMAFGLWSDEFDQQLLAALEDLEEYEADPDPPPLPRMLAEREAMELRQTLNMPNAAQSSTLDQTVLGPASADTPARNEERGVSKAARTLSRL